MEFSEFREVLALWCQLRPAIPLDCWIDEANARLSSAERGVRCSIDVLDPYDGSDVEQVSALLSHGGAGIACACEGALGIDADTHCVVLLIWMADPCTPADVFNCLESLANQRAALLALLKTSSRTTVSSPGGRTTINSWQPGV